MSDMEQEQTPAEGDRRSDPMTGLLRQALADPPPPKKSLLPAIQERIRVRTRGRYYRDRWSTTKDPVPLLLLAALLILILAAATFLVFQPLVDQPEKTQLPSPPVDPMTDQISNTAENGSKTPE